MVRQMMLGLRSAGAQVYEFNTDLNADALDTEGREYDRGRFGPVWLRWEKLRPIVEEFRPELIVCNAGGLSFRPAQAGELRKSRKLLGIALSDPDVFPLSTSRIAGNFDLFLTNAAACVPQYRAMGVRANLLPLATNEEFFHPVPSRGDCACDVAVIGRAHADRIEPVRRLCQEFDVRIYGEEWERNGLPAGPPLYGDELLSVLNSARISVVFCRTPAGHAILKVAIFDFIAAGALVATEYVPELEHYFRYDQEIVGFHETEDLVRKIRYYLRQPEAADAVRSAGRKRVLNDHVWRKVWPAITDTLYPAEVSRCSNKDRRL